MELGGNMNTVIYYPFLSPPPEWLRLAALCWDKVYRIKPQNARDDSEEVQELDQAFGSILQSIDPANPEYIYENPNYRNEPDLYMKSVKEFRVELRRKFESWIKTRGDRLKAKPLSSDEGIHLAYYVGLLSSKFPDTEILKILEKHGLAKSGYKPIEGTEKQWLLWELEGISLPPFAFCRRTRITVHYETSHVTRRSDCFAQNTFVANKNEAAFSVL
jgi:hypothetical protein